MLYRSLLFVPAYNQQFIQSAMKSEADAIILDIEDSVPYHLKNEARNNIANIQQLKGNYTGELIVRVNSLESNEYERDFQAIDFTCITTLMLPKIDCKLDLHTYEAKLDEITKKNCLFLPLIETPKSILNLQAILEHTNVIGIAFGGEDYLTSIHGEHFDGISKAFDYPKSMVVNCAKAYEKVAIDTPFLKLDNLAGLKADIESSKELGFDGKLCIHPKQAEQINKILTPSIEEVEFSQKIVDSLLKAKEKGKGVTILDGKMIGPPMQKRAMNILRLKEKIQQKMEGCRQ